jgi:iron complex outermembrane recepter protein
MRSISMRAAATAAILFAGLSSPLTPAASAADASAAEGVSLTEIVVTAERRAESIQSVPLSVTAITGNTLTKFDQVNFDDYAHLVPNLSFGTGNTFGITNGREITIRGIAGFNTTSYYINDTPLPLSIDPRAINLERVEVLSGPQGTLFGSSAMGGTVRLITRQPDLNNGFGSADAQGYVIHEGGPGYMVSGTYNLPIIDNQLALMLSGYSTYNPGVFTGEYGIPTSPGDLIVPASQPLQSVDHLGNDVEGGATIALTYRPAALDALTITPMIMHQNESDNGFPLADYYTQNLIQVRPLNIRESDTDIWTFGNLTMKYAAPFGAFIDSTTYFHRYARDTEDGSELISIGGYGGPPIPTCVADTYCASPSPNWVNTNQFTEELRFESGFAGPVQLVAGAFYNKTRLSIISEEVLPYDGLGEPAFTENIPRVYEETAGFVSATYKVFEPFELSAGVRYSHLEYSNIYIATGWINGGIGCDVPSPTGCQSYSPAFHSEKEATPRYTAKWKFNESNMIYANASKGYRIGGENAQLPSICDADWPPGTSQYKSDSLWSYEIGSKNTWLDGKINSRVAGFRIDWNQMQQSILLACSFHVTQNVGSAVSKGAELEVDAAPFEGLYLNMTLGYDDAALTSVAPGAPLPVGSPLNGVPRWTGSLLSDYSWPTSFGKGFVRGQYSFTGRSISNNNPVSVYVAMPAGRERGSYSLVNLFVGGKHESWEASLFVKNLCDVRGNLGDEQSEISELPGRPRWQISQPRTIGIDVKKQF